MQCIEDKQEKRACNESIGTGPEFIQVRHRRLLVGVSQPIEPDIVNVYLSRAAGLRIAPVADTN